MKKLYLLPLLFIAALATGCKTDGPDGPVQTDEELEITIVSSDTEFGAFGGTGKIVFETNVDKTVKVQTSDTWLSFKKKDKTITYNIPANEKATRSATITVGTGEGAKEVTVNQAALTYEDNIGGAWEAAGITFGQKRTEYFDIKVEANATKDALVLKGLIPEDIVFAYNATSKEISIDLPLRLEDRDVDGTKYPAFLCGANVGALTHVEGDITLGSTATFAYPYLTYTATGYDGGKYVSGFVVCVFEDETMSKLKAYDGEYSMFVLQKKYAE